MILKILLVFGIPVLIMGFLIKVSNGESTGNEKVDNIGCCLSLLLIGALFLFGIVGSCKSCISDISNSSNNYYDSPRK